MRQQLAITVLAAIVAFPAIAAAQIKTLPGEKITLTATVESIERASRLLTLKGADGKLTAITVPKEVTRFDALKVGDTLTATYYDNIVLRKKEPGEKDVNTLSGAAMKTDSTRPGGSVSAQRTITATITAIDPSVPSISLSGPNKWTYSSRIADKEALKQLKVGDRLDITWTEAVLISAEAPKK